MDPLALCNRTSLVFADELTHDAPRVVDIQRTLGSDALSLDRAMIALQLAVALRIVGTGSYVGHASDTNEFLEIPGRSGEPI